MSSYRLKKSDRIDKKYMVITPDGKTIHFGAKGYSDFTKHKNVERKQRYDARHKKNEDWTKSGINTAGFWAKKILWSRPTIREAINAIEKEFGITIN
jgi:hypothetical protein